MNEHGSVILYTVFLVLLMGACTVIIWWRGLVLVAHAMRWIQYRLVGKRQFQRLLLTLDLDAITVWAIKYGVAIPQEREQLLKGMHYLRATSRDLPEEARNLSRQWLHDQGIALPDAPNVQE